MKRTVGLATLLALAIVSGGQAVSASPAIRMFPRPGSYTASPQTQITFRGAPPSQIGNVLVVGQITGIHAGELRMHSDGRGASFLPDQPFHQGETVVVTIGREIAGANGSSAQFGIAIPVTPQSGQANTVRPEATGWRSYWSAPGLKAPNVTVHKAAEDTRSGVFMLTESFGPSGAGPFMVDHTGKLIWFKPLPAGVSATDFRAWTYRNRPVLSWWEGAISQGAGFGEHVVMDDTYRELVRVRAGNGYRSDLHDFVLNDDRTAWVMIYNWLAWHPLTLRLGGGAVVEGVIQKIDIPTGLVLFEWHSLDHIGVEESYAPSVSNGAYDYIHINSMEVLPNGNLLVSARHTSSVIQIDTTSGDVVWRLGGRNSDFAVASDAQFAFQHDARLLGNGLITIFDNGAGPIQSPAHTFSSGLQLRIDYTGKTVSAVQRFAHPDKTLSWSQGNMPTLANGSSVVGWGSQPAFSQYDTRGRLTFHASMSPGSSYRAYRMPWRGRPTQDPSFVVHRSGGLATTYVSWAGDTEAAYWQVLAGSSPRSLRPVVKVRRTGFETALRARTSAKYFAVRAFDSSGRVIRTSPAKAA